jgi:hypothetical protein
LVGGSEKRNEMGKKGLPSINWWRGREEGGEGVQAVMRRGKKTKHQNKLELMWGQKSEKWKRREGNYNDDRERWKFFKKKSIIMLNFFASTPSLVLKNLFMFDDVTYVPLWLNDNMNVWLVNYISNYSKSIL